MGCFVKSIRRGTTSISSASSSVSVTLPETINTSKTIFFFSAKNDQSSVWDFAVRLNVDSSTQITFTRSGNTGILYISWEYVQFTEESDVLVQHGSVAMSSTSVQVTLPTAVDTSKSWIMISWQRANTALNQSCFAKAKFINNGAGVQFDSYSTMTQTLNYQVIQYGNCSVQTLELTNVNAQNTTYSINSVDTTKTATFTSCSAYLSQTYNMTMIYRVSVDSSTAIRFQKYGGAGNGFNITCFVVTFTDDTTVDQYSVTFTTSDTLVNQTVTSRSMQKSVVHISNCDARLIGSTDSATYDAGFGMQYAQRTTNTNVAVSRVETGANSVVIIQVITFVGGPFSMYDPLIPRKRYTR